MKPIDVLFLCETNAAASLMAEALVNHRASAQFRAFSAGRVPARSLLAEARRVLEAEAIPVDALEPKAWSIFALPGGRRPDLIVDLATVSWTTPELVEIAGGAVLRWPLRDPALQERPMERFAVAREVFAQLASRIESRLLTRLDRAVTGPTPAFA
jgi:arsenate reductase